MTASANAPTHSDTNALEMDDGENKSRRQMKNGEKKKTKAKAMENKSTRTPYYSMDVVT